MFDPFEDRTSRDIRNKLSEHFLELLRERDWAGFERQASRIVENAPGPDHARFIENRTRIYRAVFEHLPDTGTNAFEIGRLLWDSGLFFECHEWLEPLWLDASGPEKKAVQGIIRAAGAHVLREAGRIDAARSSARKAAVLIRDHRSDVPGAFDAGDLIRTLGDLASD